MTTRLAVRFPLGRYHATPWDASVNEGKVEWPPSPWRILRALVSVWKTRLTHLEEDWVMGLLNRLMIEPPSYLLPITGTAHTRHYMPKSEHGMNKPGKNRSLALDPFLSVSPDQDLIVEFAYTVGEAEREVLSALVGSMPYLGRADSVCHARLVETSSGKDHAAIRCTPGLSERGGFRLLVPEPPFSLEDLCESPTDLRKSKRIDPTKARWVDYKTINNQAPSRRLAKSRPRPPITAARWHLPDAGTPPVAETVAIGHLLRRAVMKLAKEPSNALSGRTDSGRREDQHKHAHYLAFSCNDDGRIDTLAIWAPEGLGERDFAGITSLRYLRSPKDLRRLGTYRLGLEVLASKGDEDLALPEFTGQSQEWVSATPYIPGRSSRSKNWNDTEERMANVTDDLNEELGHRGFPKPSLIEECEEVNKPDWRRYRRIRPGQPGRGRPATWLRLVFDNPVPGPLALGALSHFGLGLFKPHT